MAKGKKQLTDIEKHNMEVEVKNDELKKAVDEIVENEVEFSKLNAEIEILNVDAEGNSVEIEEKTAKIKEIESLLATQKEYATLIQDELNALEEAGAKLSAKENKKDHLSNAEIMEFVKELSDMVEKEYNLRKREGTIVVNGKKTNHMDLDQTRIGLKRSYAVLFELTGRQSRIG